MATGSDYIFYCVGAVVTETYNHNTYKLWLLDFRNIPKTQSWREGKPIPPDECVEVNRTYTVQNPGENNAIHIAKSMWLNLTTSDDMTRGFTIPARFTIISSLWNKIPQNSRPLPPGGQDYRIKVVIRRDNSGIIREYLGFHVKVLETENGKSRIQFYSWTNDALGAPILDLTTSDFDPISNGHSTIGPNSSPATEGALFVSSEYIYSCGFLVVPKVPYGAGKGSVADSVISMRNRALAHRTLQNDERKQNLTSDRNGAQKSNVEPNSSTSSHSDLPRTS